MTMDDLSRLMNALGGSQADDILELLARRFSGEAAAEIQDFLDDHHIPREFWCRHGD